MSANFAQDSHADRGSQFKITADKLSLIAAKHGLNFRGYHSPDLPLFHALSVEKQRAALAQLKVFLQTWESAESAGDRLDSHDRSLWHAMLTLRLVPPADMFRLVQPGKVVEIYDMQGIQIWRNFSFLKICSYTLEEMHAIEWPLRYHRDASKNEECLGKVHQVISGQTEEIFHAGITAHRLEETSSEDRYILEAAHDWIGRLKNHEGQTVAWFVTSDVKIIGSAKMHGPRIPPRLSLVPELGPSL